MTINSDIKRAICELTVVTRTNIGLEVTVPVIYPDGELANVIVDRDEEGVLVHDASGGVMHLSAVGVKLTGALQSKYREFAAKYGCEFAAGRVFRRCEENQIGLAAALVANASKAIADQSLETKRRIETAFRDAVAARVHECGGKRVRDNQQLKGKSGLQHRVRHVLLDGKLKRPVAFVEPSATQNVVPSHFVAFADLKPVHPRVHRLSVCDKETLKPQHMNLLRTVSEIATISTSGRKIAEWLQ